MPIRNQRLRSLLAAPAIASLAVLLQVYATAQDVAFATTRSSDQKFDLDLPLGLPPGKFSVPADNPMSADKIALGRTLFFDERLSLDDSVACASCHVPQHAFTDGRRTARGIGLQTGPRNTPTIINRAFSSAQFLDGRAASLEEQVKGPLTNAIEMGMPTHEIVVQKVAAIAGYERWFRRIFGRGVHIDDIAKAIAAFERTIVSGGSRADRFIAGDQDAINESEKRGFAIFNGKARCSQCHSGPLFTDEKFHNIGIGWDGDQIDLGRYRVTGAAEDIGAFKTPTLREIGLTFPYMHNGAFSTLEETIEFYNNGGISNPFLDIEMKRPTRTLEQLLAHYEKAETERTGPAPGSEPAKLNLTDQERIDLAAFLRTLSGDGWQDIGPPDSFPE